MAVDLLNVVHDVVNEFLVVDCGVVFDPVTLDGYLEALKDTHV